MLAEKDIIVFAQTFRSVGNLFPLRLSLQSPLRPSTTTHEKLARQIQIIAQLIGTNFSLKREMESTKFKILRSDRTRRREMNPFASPLLYTKAKKSEEEER